jgi:hypothetical protein
MSADGQKYHFIKGQKYTLLSNCENLTMDGRRSPTKLLKVNKRLNTAYLLGGARSCPPAVSTSLRRFKTA